MRVDFKGGMDEGAIMRTGEDYEADVVDYEDAEVVDDESEGLEEEGD